MKQGGKQGGTSRRGIVLIRNLLKPSLVRLLKWGKVAVAERGGERYVMV